MHQGPAPPYVNALKPPYAHPPSDIGQREACPTVLSANAKLCVLRKRENCDRGRHWCSGWCSCLCVCAIHSWGTLVVFIGPAHSAWDLRALRSQSRRAIGVKEMIDGVPYVVAGLVFAFVSVRRSAVVVGVFWLLRGLYDLAHSQFITNTGVAGWYPVSVLWLMLLSARIFHGHRGVFPMQLFARRKSKRCRL